MLTFNTTTGLNHDMNALEQIRDRAIEPATLSTQPGDIPELRSRFCGVTAVEGQLDLWLTPEHPLAFDVSVGDAAAALDGDLDRWLLARYREAAETTQAVAELHDIVERQRR